MAEIDLKSDAFAQARAANIPSVWAETMVVAAFAAALSLLQTGFVFGIENNLFHLPIVAGLYDEPQYRDDAFIQSLRHFSSGVWLLLGSSEKHFGHTRELFFVLAYLSRLLSFIGFLCCASLAGVTGRRDKIVFSLIVCFISFLSRESYAGTGGLFLNYFTHSEIANGTILLAVYFAAKGRFTAATAATGVTFFINAFMAVWLALPLACVAASLVAERKATLRQVSLQILIGLVPCAVLAWPVLANIVGNPEFGQPIDFDYVTFLHQYFAGHMLIDSVPAMEIAGLVAVALLGGVAFYRLGPDSRALQAAYGGAILLYAIGVVIPFITSAPLVLNLHLLRSSTIIHLLAGLAVAALATRWLGDRRSPLFLPGCFLVLLLAPEGFTFALCIPIVIGARFATAWRPSDPSVERVFALLVIGLTVAVIWPLSAWQNHRFNRLMADSAREWTEVGAWAKNATPATAIFLPPSLFDVLDMSDPAKALTLSRSSVFEFVSHRRVWMDYKRGAAAMWTPSFYKLWLTRLTEVEQLVSLQQRLDYASRHGIGYVIDGCDSTQTRARALFRTERLCVFEAETEAESPASPAGSDMPAR